ncbi:MAG: metallophosphoesterase family protein [Clostridia bacterium]|nr:metallophosphoesterase family protein [Clostridia bacterium]
MKYAIISDIHGNLPALELAIADAQANGADAFLLAGDYCTSAPWGSAVVDKLRALPNALHVRGNEEDYLHLPQGDDGQFQVTYWSSRQLRADQLAWLDELPHQVEFECEGVCVHMAHSSQAFIGNAAYERRPSRLAQLYPTGCVTREAFLADTRRTLDESPVFHEKLLTLPKGVYIFGHSHNQWHARFGDHLFINPGSCGINLDCAEFAAVYTLLSIENGECTVEERRIPYDAEALIAEVKQTEQYHAARVWTEIIFDEWRTCRDQIYFFLRHTEAFAQSIGDERRPFSVDTWEKSYEQWKNASLF